MSDKCPVCGDELWCTLPGGRVVFDCGKSASTPCPKAEHLAIDRQKEVEELRRRIVSAGEIIRTLVPVDIGPVDALVCGEWVKWYQAYLEKENQPPG